MSFYTHTSFSLTVEYSCVASDVSLQVYMYIDFQAPGNDELIQARVIVKSNKCSLRTSWEIICGRDTDDLLCEDT